MCDNNVMGTPLAYESPAMQRIRRGRMARALVIAVLQNKETAARTAGVTTKTIDRWLARLDTDEQLSEIFQRRLDDAEGKWEHEAQKAIVAMAGFLQRAGRDLASNDPVAVSAASDAAQKMAEIATIKRVVDARFAGANGSEAGHDRKELSEAEAVDAELLED